MHRLLVKVHQRLSSFRLFPGVAELGGVVQTLLVDFGVEGLAFALLDFEVSLEVLLLSVHLRLVLQSVLVQHLILTLACGESLLISLIVIQFFHNA